MVSFLSTFPLTWELYTASWRKDWKSQQKIISKLDDYFNKDIPLVSNLMWNCIMFALNVAVTVHYAGFSKDFEIFCLCTYILPSIGGSIGFYCYKYGAMEVLTSLSLTSFLQWCQNWIAMQGISLVGLMQSVFLYLVGIQLQAFLLPPNWNFSITFSTEVYEDSLRLLIYFFAILFAMCTLALPLWKRGYEVSMQAAGRPNVTISHPEILMELIYQTSQAGTLTLGITPLLVLLKNYCGFQIYAIHIVFAVLEVLLINFTVQYKFCIMHQLMHEIKPLYHLTHIEHHVCKGVYPTTSGVGLWESWTSGQDNLFTAAFGFNTVPYLTFHMGNTGVNLVVHTMWPSPNLLQWHTLHHTILADVYNLNIPSPYDKDHSKSVAKLQKKLEDVSPFIRYEALSDGTAFVIMVAIGIILHYGLGVGIFTVDWEKHMTIEYR